MNSASGSAACNASPAVAKAIQHENRPLRLTSVLPAGCRRGKAGEKLLHRLRAKLTPDCAVQEWELVYMLERHRIEGRTTDDIAKDLTRAFDKYCEETTAA